MKFSLCLCLALTFANRGFARNLGESTVIPSTESTLNFSVNPMPKTESTLNTTENAVILNNEASSTSTENTPESSEERPQMDCGENMEPWETFVSEKGVWECLCKLPFLPSPMNNTCTRLFRQGPCAPGYMVIQPQPAYEEVEDWNPRCIPNTCRDDGLVFYKGTCHNITVDMICDNGAPYYHQASSEIRCAGWINVSGITAPKRNPCSTGSRPDRYGVCRKKL